VLALRVPRRTRATALFVLTVGLAVAACKTKATSSQCDALLDRYAQLVVVEKYPDASAAQIDAERTRERTEARGDDAFKNCSSEVSSVELTCAMSAISADAVLKCLE
jgi:hypothetical protein